MKQFKSKKQSSLSGRFDRAFFDAFHAFCVLNCLYGPFIIDPGLMGGHRSQAGSLPDARDIPVLTKKRDCFMIIDTLKGKGGAPGG